MIGPIGEVKDFTWTGFRVLVYVAGLEGVEVHGGECGDGDPWGEDDTGDIA